MKAVTRYIILFVGCVIYFYLLYYDFNPDSEEIENSPSFWSSNSVFEGAFNEQTIGETSAPPCSMSTCFDFSKCENKNKLKIYVYPNIDGLVPSEVYLKILKAIRESAYYTANPLDACLFILSVDTIDRDIISDNYVRDAESLISQLPKNLWNNGINHIIFNLYHGTYPDYYDHNLGFSTGKAMIARASSSVQNFRFGFDISFPLFHKEHPLRSRLEREFDLTDKDQYLVSFKGKRYVYGIGSETRDSLHHLHNGKTVAMVTTCKHNNDWQVHQDERCEKDNAEYDRWDYESTMANSTFCLTPRGRRLGSFRFLESLRLGCIPVVLSDDWVLPYAEVIDWPKAVVIISEKNVLLVPDILYSFTIEKIIRMKQFGRMLYHKYFRDVEKISLTTFEIIWERLQRSRHQHSVRWNNLQPFESNTEKSTAIILRAVDKLSSRLQRVVSIVSTVNYLQKIVVLWPSTRGVPPVGADFGMNISLFFVEIKSAGLNISALSSVLNESYVIYTDERSNPTVKELDCILQYMMRNPTRLIGVHGLDFDINLGQVSTGLVYNSVFFSMVGFHRKLFMKVKYMLRWYLTNLSSFLPTWLIDGCESLAMSIMTTEYSMYPPIIVGNRLYDSWIRLEKETTCLKRFSSRWPEGFPLLYSDLRYV